MYHNDKHVVKMVLETAQLLCSSYELAPYKKTHYNHPCSIWTRASSSNFHWLCELGFHLSEEYSFRFNKIHKSSEVIKWCYNNHHKLDFPRYNRTEFVKAMPDDCKSLSAVNSYRHYYIKYKSSFSKWTKREIPYWFQETI